MAYHLNTCLRMIGIAQIVIGVVMVVLGALYIFFAFVSHSFSSLLACGLWVGVWVIVTGILHCFGARSNYRPRNCLISVMIGFSITSCIFAVIMVIVQSFDLAVFTNRLGCPKNVRESLSRLSSTNYQYDKCVEYKDYDVPSYSKAKIGLAICSVLLALAVVEFFVALISSIYGCNNSNNCCFAAGQPVQQVAYLQQPGGNSILIRSGGIPPGAPLHTISAQPGQVVPAGQPREGYI